MNFCNNACIVLKELRDFTGIDPETCLPEFNTTTKLVELSLELTRIQANDTEGVQRQVFEFRGRTKYKLEPKGKEYRGEIILSDNSTVTGKFTFQILPKSVLNTEQYFGYKVQGTFYQD